MSSNRPQVEYFVAKSEDLDGGNRFSVFHAPNSSGLAIPKEVLRIMSIKNFAGGRLFQIITGDLETRDPEPPIIEPRTIEQLGEELGSFLRANPSGGIFIDESAPQEVIDAVEDVGSNISGESKARLADMLGISLEATETDSLKTGMYL